MKAIIMAGGEGTRLRPLTLNTPKPMVHILDRPIMEYIIELLKKHGINDIYVTLMYLPHIITDHFEDGGRFDVKLQYFKEESPLGTAGSVKNASLDIEDTFLVISGDCLTDIDLSGAIRFHQEKDALVTIVLNRVDRPYEYGIVVTDEEGRITKFLEKPSPSETFTNTINTGIYIINKRALSYFGVGAQFDFSKDLFPLLLSQNEPIYGYTAGGYWCDVGDLKAYRDCHKDILEGRVDIMINGSLKDKKVILGANSLLEIGVTVEPPVYIGANTFVESGAEISAYTVIGANSIVSSKSRVNGAILDRGCFIGKNAIVDHAVLGKSVKLKTGAKVDEMSVIGEESIIGEYSIIKPNTKVWNNKKVDDGQIISKNIINTVTFPRSPFGDHGMEGDVSIDFPPENMAHLGACFSALLKNSKIVISCDENPASLMAKSAVVAGIMSSGGTACDLGSGLMFVLRNAVSFYGAGGGIFISHNDRLRIQFVDSDSTNIDRGMEARLEAMLKKDDFARASHMQVKAPLNIENYTSFYGKSVQNKFGKINSERFLYFKSESRLVYDYINEISKEIGISPISLKEKSLKNGEISANFFDNGERVVLYTENGDVIEDDYFFMLMSLLLKDAGEKKMIIPPYMSDRALAYAEENGLKVQYSKNNYASFMKEMIKQGLMEQFALFFDGVYSALKVFEYCAAYDSTLSDIINKFPKIYKTTRRLDLESDKRGDIMHDLLEKNKENYQIYDGLKINQKNGWVFIFPDNAKYSFTIITEGVNEEYSKELCDFYAREIKDLENSQLP